LLGISHVCEHTSCLSSRAFAHVSLACACLSRLLLLLQCCNLKVYKDINLEDIVCSVFCAPCVLAQIATHTEAGNLSFYFAPSNLTCCMLYARHARRHGTRDARLAAFTRLAWHLKERERARLRESTCLASHMPHLLCQL
jgi:hypothetical protein